MKKNIINQRHQIPNYGSAIQCEDEPINIKIFAGQFFDEKNFSSFTFTFNEEEILNVQKYEDVNVLVNKLVKKLFKEEDEGKIIYFSDMFFNDDVVDEYLDAALNLSQGYTNSNIKPLDLNDPNGQRLSYKKSFKNMKIRKYIYVCKQDDIIYAISKYNIFVFTLRPYYSEMDFKNDVETIAKCVGIGAAKNEAKQSTVNLVVQKSYGFDNELANINPMNIDFKKNYNDGFEDTHKEILKFLNERTSGLVILRGEPGTGKTSYIKHLITNYAKQYVIVTNNTAEHLAEPGFVNYLLENKNSVFILEDCEQILKDRSSNLFSNAITNILNMTDGIMSDIFNIKFICTFNAPLTNIDKALLRPGRCLVDYEFGKLDRRKTFELINELYPGSVHTELDVEPMTLASIYNYDKKEIEKATGIKINEKKKSIGF